jgi:hypothetical protein
MTSANLKLTALSMLATVGMMSFAACGSGDDNGGAPDCPQNSSPDNPAIPSGANILPVTISTSPYANAPVNQPLVSVTICVPGSNTCQTIDNLLLDTGSYGLRIFRSLINISLPAVVDPGNSSNTLAECVGYLTGSQWGPLAVADVIMGSEKASSVNIQEVDAGFPTGIPSTSDCHKGADTDAATAGYNGIIGVGLVSNDCGTGCTDPQATYYFSCNSGTCSTETVDAAHQTQNPISKMPAGFNNGVALTLPNVDPCGDTGTQGYLALGVGTVANNNTPPASVNILKADPTFLTMLTTFQGTQNHNAFIDSGSNTLGIYPSGSVLQDLGNCGGGANGFFCPTDSPTLSATMQANTGGAQATVPFQIVNSFSLIDSGNNAFSTLGSYSVNDEFDWGINFFYGRTVYVVIKGSTASGLGTGPLWAF